MMECLSRKQRAFVRAFDGDAIGAASAAGYTDPKASAKELMKNPRVLAAIESRREGDRGGPDQIVLTPEQVQQVRVLSAYMTQQQIGDFFGFNERTFRKIKARQPNVEAAYKAGRAAGVGRVAEGLYQMAAGGDLTAMIFYLKTQAGWRETTRHDVDHRSSDGSMTPKAAVQLTDAELARIASGDGDGD